tara:strand:- start:7272 stop:7871 length:600 start_codon:yes stop_codon:yes gene_type:complete
MSFRIEEKVILHTSDYLKLKKIINKENKDSALFPSRKITSLYFDNNYNEMFQDSQEGSLPRKKIRIRTYPESLNNEFFLEEKINSCEGKFKKSLSITKKQYFDYYNQGIFDKTYNNCQPKLWVKYEREYLSYLGFRLTIDKNLEFSMPKIKHTSKLQDKLILEVKSKNLECDIFDGIFPFERSRFSKYCEGIKLIYERI